MTFGQCREVDTLLGDIFGYFLVPDVAFETSLLSLFTSTSWLLVSHELALA